jgi:LmbE family N-acetylglucosaminyl deacetylase
VNDDFRRRQRWIETHTDWIPCKLPHFSIRDNAFYFLADGRPVLAAPPSLLELTAAVDGDADIATIVEDTSHVDALARLWAPGIVTFVPPATSEAGPCILAIEPHPDDVALSAGGALLLRRDTTRKTILSVTSRSNATFYMATPELRYFDVDVITRLRHEESVLAARFLKARYRTLNEPDITIRYIEQQRYMSGDVHLTMRDQSAYRHAPPPIAVIERVSTLLWQAIQETSPDEIWLPLGLGNHFDHRLTRDACLYLICRYWKDLHRIKLMFYEDLPYAWYHPGTAAAIVGMMRRRGASLRRHSLDIGSVLPDKMECLRIYASQFQSGELPSVIEGHARMTSGTDAGYAETLWQLIQPPSFPFAPLVVVGGMPRALVEQSARRVFERRLGLRRLGLLIGTQISSLDEPARALVDLFPNALINVLALRGNGEEDMNPFDQRSCRWFVAGSKWDLLISLIRWALLFNDMILIFSGPRRAREARWLSKMLPRRYVYVFENLEDMCGLWQYWLSEEQRDGGLNG